MIMNLTKQSRSLNYMVIKTKMFAHAQKCLNTCDAMSLYRWLASSQTTTPSYLPPAEANSSTAAANEAVSRKLDPSGKRKRARGEYHHYTAETPRKHI